VLDFLRPLLVSPMDRSDATASGVLIQIEYMEGSLFANSNEIFDLIGLMSPFSAFSQPSMHPTVLSFIPSPLSQQPAACKGILGYRAP
jgi:hypothetical protein